MGHRTVELGKIVSGGTGALRLDVQRLVQTRMSVMASSGGGKTYALLRILEATRGLMPQCVFDPEGDFTPLRRNASYDYVLAAPKGGDIVAHPSTAAVLARHFTERNFSLLIDLYEMDLPEQRRFVRLFCEGLLAAPRKLWRPRLIVVDECQEFAPEKGGDAAESLPALIRVAKKGRKRGLTLVTATQRPADISKALTSQLGNKLVGVAYTDTDQDRAARELRMRDQEKADTLAKLEPGHFYAVGRALGHDLKLVKMDMPKDRPDEGGKTALRKPPAPGPRLKAVLATLAELPKEAQEEARTVNELKAEVQRLKGELRKAKAPFVSTPQVSDDSKRYKQLQAELVKRKEAEMQEQRRWIEESTKATKKLVADVVQKHADQVILAMRGHMDKVLAGMPKLKVTITPLPAPKPSTIYYAPKSEKVSVLPEETPDPGKLGACEANILAFLTYRISGSTILPSTKVQVAFGSGDGYAVGSGGLRNALGRLRSLGLITGGNADIKITGKGFEAAPERASNLTAVDLWLRNCGAAERKIFELMHADRVPYTKEEIAGKCGYQASSGGLRNAIGRLCSLGLLQRRGPEVMLGPEGEV